MGLRVKMCNFERAHSIQRFTYGGQTSPVVVGFKRLFPQKKAAGKWLKRFVVNMGTEVP
jgi:hypothetical protein